jgi:hypothetical protein
MRIFDNLEEMGKSQVDLRVYRTVQASLEDVVGDNVENLQELSFTEVFGGKVHVLEITTDVEGVEFTVEVDGQYDFTNLSHAAKAFDRCEYILDGTYVFIYDVKGDSGGPSYFIPSNVADKCLNVQLSIELTNG